MVQAVLIVEETMVVVCKHVYTRMRISRGVILRAAVSESIQVVAAWSRVGSIQDRQLTLSLQYR